jgi:hypothetical protein
VPSILTDACVNTSGIVSKLWPWLGVGVYKIGCRDSGMNGDHDYIFLQLKHSNQSFRIIIFMPEFGMSLEIEAVNYKRLLCYTFRE